MPYTPTRRNFLSMIGLGAVAAGASSCGQGTMLHEAAAHGEFPSRDIEFIVPTAPGGSHDTLSRVIANGLQSELSVNVTPENKPGAGSTIGMRLIADASSEGYRLGLLPANVLEVRSLTIEERNPLAVDDFTVISGVSVEDVVVYTSPGSDFETATDLLNYEGDVLAFASAGPGTVTGTGLMLFMEHLPARVTEVPFEGGGPAKTAVLGEQLPIGAAHPGEIIPDVEAEDLVPLVVLGRERNAAFPDAPTAQELGIDLELEQRRVLVGPPGMNEDTRDSLAQLVRQIGETEDVQSVFNQWAMDYEPEDGDAAAEGLVERAEAYQDLVEDLGVDLIDD